MQENDLKERKEEQESIFDQLTRLRSEYPDLAQNVADIDVECFNKAIPFLIKIGSEESMQLKQRIIDESNLKSDHSKTKRDYTQLISKDGYLTFPSVGRGSMDANIFSDRTILKARSNSDWVIQCKMDGSNLSFSFSENKINKLAMFCGSSPCTNNVAFDDAKKSLTILGQQGLFNPNFMYHVEYIHRLRHNVTVYDRLPRYFVVVFDIQELDTKRWLNEEEIELECQRIGLEKTQLFWDNRRGCGTMLSIISQELENMPIEKRQSIVTLIQKNDDGGETQNRIQIQIDNVSWLIQLTMDAIESGKIESCLGGQPEGFVFKNRIFFNEKKNKQSYCIRKFITETFEERRYLKKPKSKLFSVTEHLRWIGLHFDVPARFRKAYQRLRDSNLSLEEQRDIAIHHRSQEIEKSLDLDLKKEATDEISAYLTGNFRNRCRRNHEDDLDQNDESLKRLIQAFPNKNDINDTNIVEFFMPQICIYARSSLEAWCKQAETIEWIYCLFG
jgi:hypothetical protein